MDHGYDRLSAIRYAKRWALLRNPAYLDFSLIGGDCTSFVSQCLYAGAGVMNFTPVYGWYYLNPNDRTASWTGVEYLYRFLTGNHGPGPYARETDAAGTVAGDVIQLGDGLRFTHTVLIVAKEAGEIYVAAHSNDAWRKPLSEYTQPAKRFLHIEGAQR